MKLANELLKTRRVRREKEKQKFEKEKIELNNQGQITAVQEAAKHEQSKIQMKSQADLALVAAKSEAEQAKIAAEKDAKSELMQQEFEYNMTIKGIDTENLLTQDKYKENRKDERQSKNNTQASKMIEQRNNNAPAVNFESSEDNISGGVEMGELEPS